jgi:hypothetical protein
MPDKRTIEDSHDERGWFHRWLTLHDDGRLEIGGQDIGPIVERFLGGREYEFARTVAPEAIPGVRALLGLGAGDDLLDALCARFTGPGASDQLERYLQENGIETSFWSRVGD